MSGWRGRVASKRLVLLATLATTLGLAVVTIPTDRASGGTQCGVWRWDVKTLSDPHLRKVDFQPEAAKIGRLRRLDAPKSLDTDAPSPPRGLASAIRALQRLATRKDKQLIVSSV